MIFWEEDDGGENISGGSSSGEGEAQVKEAAQPSFDPKALAAEFGSVMREQFNERDAKQEKQKTFSPEEIANARKELGIFDPDDAWLTRFDNLETRKQAILEMRDAMLGSQNKITQAMLAQQHAQWEERFQPVAQMLTQREESERVSRFHSKYSELSDPKLQPLIHSVGTQLAQQGAFKGLTESQAFDKLAQGVESVFQTKNPGFKLSQTNGGKSSNEISAEPSGARGGGGQSNGGAKPDSPNGLFGPVKSSKR